MACSLKIWSDQRFLCIKNDQTPHQKWPNTKVYFSRYLEGMQEFYVQIYDDLLARDGLRTPNEGMNQGNLKIWADVTD